MYYKIIWKPYFTSFTIQFKLERFFFLFFSLWSFNIVLISTKVQVSSVILILNILFVISVFFSQVFRTVNFIHKFFVLIMYLVSMVIIALIIEDIEDIVVFFVDLSHSFFKTDFLGIAEFGEVHTRLTFVIAIFVYIYIRVKFSKIVIVKNSIVSKFLFFFFYTIVFYDFFNILLFWLYNVIFRISFENIGLIVKRYFFVKMSISNTDFMFIFDHLFRRVLSLKANPVMVTVALRLGVLLLDNVFAGDDSYHLLVEVDYRHVAHL
mmetsp:Transcript_16982/g.37387  ORF Transcript_16982/g.37387 Transcript_16982/m.37387 type:complete len:265 (+) Transcript_16982:10-804(+)